MNKKVSLRNPMAILASVTVAISSVFISVSTPISANAAATWTQQTSAGTLVWNSIASSADGTKLAATALWDGSYNPRGIFTSTDSGATWTEQTSAGNALWHGIASSADGTKLVAVQQFNGSYGAGSIFTSTDSGATWTERTSAGKALWQSVASSADGTHLVIISNQTSGFAPGNIFTSADSGVTWTLQTGAPNSPWSSVTSSDDGTKLAATQDGGRIFTSTDSGVNWTEQMGAGQLSWSSIASSADGSKLLAADAGRGSLWRSTDGGATWTDISGNISGFWYWRAVASSDDGNTLAIAADLDMFYDQGAILTSVDGGASWSRETGAGIAAWSALAINSDGSKIAATSSASGASSGSIWTNYGSSAPATAPALSASTPSIPNTYTGSTSATQTETITNTGDGDLVFGTGAVTVTGTNSGDYTIVADNCSNQTVAPAGTCTVTYTFSPGGVGSRTANLVFTSNNASSPDSVVLTATGVGLPLFSASTPSIAKTYVGSFSTVQTETITNAGNADLVFGAGAVTKTGANATDFTIVADNCSNHTVAPAATCTVTYKFKSTVAGTRTANLVFASNAASSPNSVVLSVVAMGVVTIKKIDSTSGSYKGGVKVEITGTGFTAGSTVTFGGLTAVITKRTGTTSISVKTPAHAVGAVPVVVTNPDGGTATYNSYTYKK